MHIRPTFKFSMRLPTDVVKKVIFEQPHRQQYVVGAPKRCVFVGACRSGGEEKDFGNKSDATLVSKRVELRRVILEYALK